MITNLLLPASVVEVIETVLSVCLCVCQCVSALTAERLDIFFNGHSGMVTVPDPFNNSPCM